MELDEEAQTKVDAYLQRDDEDYDEFDDFMQKVNEVNAMVKALTASNNGSYQEAAQEADLWLENQKEEKRSQKEKFEETKQVRKKETKAINKTTINEKAFKEPEKKPEEESLDKLNSETMSQQAFMSVIEADAKKRTKERLKRKRESDAIKMDANKAFRDGEFEKALDLFNKAIDVRKDSCLLYINRALTLINLQLFTRALKDCETALKLDENCFKAKLYQARAHFGMGDEEMAEKVIEEVKTEFPEKVYFVEDYQKTWERNLEDEEFIERL